MYSFKRGSFIYLLSFILTNNCVREAHRAAYGRDGPAQKTGNKVGIAIGAVIEKAEKNLGCRAQKQPAYKQEFNADLVNLYNSIKIKKLKN